MHWPKSLGHAAVLSSRFLLAGMGIFLYSPFSRAVLWYYIPAERPSFFKTICHDMKYLFLSLKRNSRFCPKI